MGLTLQGTEIDCKELVEYSGAPENQEGNSRFGLGSLIFSTGIIHW